LITSANSSSHRSRRVEAAHYEMDEIRREFGHRRDILLIGHDDEVANRAFYPHHLPCSTSILSFHKDLSEYGRPALLVERQGSLGIDHIRKVVTRHGYGLQIAPSAQTPLPVRWPETRQLAA
jgi:hypothetical protein